MSKSMSKYKKSWILLQEKVANRAVCPEEKREMMYKNEVYAEISALMATLAADVMCDEVEDEEK